MVAHLGNTISEAFAFLDGEEGESVIGVAVIEARIVRVLHERGHVMVSLSSHIIQSHWERPKQLLNFFSLLIGNELIEWHLLFGDRLS